MLNFQNQLILWNKIVAENEVYIKTAYFSICQVGNNTDIPAKKDALFPKSHHINPINKDDALLSKIQLIIKSLTAELCPQDSESGDVEDRHRDGEGRHQPRVVVGPVVLRLGLGRWKGRGT